MKSHKELLHDARDAKDEALLWQAIKSQNSQVIQEATQNRHLTEEMARYIAKNRNATPEALAFLATDIRFRDSNRLKLALCKNPRTPHRLTLGFLKYLGIFDMADLSRNRYIPTVLRQRVEVVLMDKVKALPTGVKIALSRRASDRIVDAIMQKGDRRTIDACLESSRFTEERLFRIISRPATKPLVIRAIAEHPSWSMRITVRFALVRNFYTPMKEVERFIRELTAMDLKTLYSDPKLPSATKPFIYRELQRRDETTDLPKDVVYRLEGDEDRDRRFERHSRGELFGAVDEPVEPSGDDEEAEEADAFADVEDPDAGREGEFLELQEDVEDLEELEEIGDYGEAEEEAAGSGDSVEEEPGVVVIEEEDEDSGNGRSGTDETD